MAELTQLRLQSKIPVGLLVLPFPHCGLRQGKRPYLPKSLKLFGLHLQSWPEKPPTLLPALKGPAFPAGYRRQISPKPICNMQVASGDNDLDYHLNKSAFFENFSVLHLNGMS